MNTPFKKRSNPISINPEPEEQKVVIEPTRSFATATQHVAPKNPKPSDADKVKYTAVMDKDLRIRIKVASAKKNLQISQFIEEAVLEKLEREGY